MANSYRRTINYTPRYTDEEAYDLCPPDIRLALQNGPADWDSSVVLRIYRKLLKQFGPKTAEQRTAEMVWGWHRDECAEGKPWRTRKPDQRWADAPPSPHVAANATMALSCADALPPYVEAF